MDMTKRLPAFGATRVGSMDRIPRALIVRVDSSEREEFTPDQCVEGPTARVAPGCGAALAGMFGNIGREGGTTRAGHCRSMTKLQVITLGPRDLPRGALAFDVAAQAARQIPADPVAGTETEPSGGFQACQYTVGTANILFLV